MQLEAEVKCEVQNCVGYIKLNRPKSLNSLTINMVKQISQQLTAWEHQMEVSMIIIEGAGEKGLCAGGDMRFFYDNKDGDVDAAAEEFFTTEYSMNLQMHRYPKPILAYMDGIVMGGGMGISIYSEHRIVTEKSRLSMPEMNIGFFPDVGASYFMNQMPGFMGRYLALTASIFNGADAIYLGAADYYLNRDSWVALKEEIVRYEHIDSKKLRNLIQKYVNNSVPDSTLARIQDKADLHFAYNSVQDILASLDRAAVGGDDWAKETASTIRSKSPISLSVTMEQLIRGESMPLEDCLKMELFISKQFMHNYNFYEGVRSVLVDKDRNPTWVPATIDEVKKEDIKNFFQQDR
jgi:enoyl-CoA hydratase